MIYNRLVFINGTFDVFHTGHLNLLDEARSLGDYVLVAIDDDDRVRELKGEGRPVNSSLERLRLLGSLRQVDSVITFSSDQELYDIIYHASSACKHFTMVKGADYKYKPIIGSELCDEIHFVELNGKSTTSILGR